MLAQSLRRASQQLRLAAPSSRFCAAAEASSEAEPATPAELDSQRFVEDASVAFWCVAREECCVAVGAFPC